MRTSASVSEKDGFFGSIRFAVSGITRVIGVIGGKGADIVESSFDSTIDDMNHSRAVKLVQNAQELTSMQVSVDEIASYQAMVELLLNPAPAPVVRVQASVPTTEAKPARPARKEAVNA